MIDFLAENNISLIKRYGTMGNGKIFIAGIDNLDLYEVWEGKTQYHVNGVGDTEEEAIDDFARFISGKTIKTKSGRSQICVVPNLLNN